MGKVKAGKQIMGEMLYFIGFQAFPLIHNSQVFSNFPPSFAEIPKFFKSWEKVGKNLGETTSKNAVSLRKGMQREYEIISMGQADSGSKKMSRFIVEIIG